MAGVIYLNTQSMMIKHVICQKFFKFCMIYDVEVGVCCVKQKALNHPVLILFCVSCTCPPGYREWSKQRLLRRLFELEKV